jgi:hypothetical protein
MEMNKGEYNIQGLVRLKFRIRGERVKLTQELVKESEREIGVFGKVI